MSKKKLSLSEEVTRSQTKMKTSVRYIKILINVLKFTCENEDNSRLLYLGVFLVCRRFPYRVVEYRGFSHLLWNGSNNQKGRQVSKL